MKTKLVKLAKRFVLFGLQSMMLVLLAQNLAYATGGTPSGSGTEGDPFLIADYEDLKVVGTDSLTYSLNSVYRLTADIDASPSTTEHGDSGFVPIGTYSLPFRGTFHGAGYVINNIMINRPNTDYIGLFGSIDAGKIDSLGLYDISVTGKNMVGGLAGRVNGTVSKSYVTGSISGDIGVGGLAGGNQYGILNGCYASSSVSGDDFVGGFVGGNSSSGTINVCYATGQVFGGGFVGGFAGENNSGTVSYCYATSSVTSYSGVVGGLVGENYANGTINNSYSTGSVTSKGLRIGGLVGYNLSGTVSYCYSVSQVVGDYYVGGVVGFNYGSATISDCYGIGPVKGISDVGALVGYNYYDSMVNSGFWNIETSELTSGIGTNNGPASVIGLTTTPMKLSINFTSWDFSSTWTILPDSTYPGLQGLDNAPFAFYDTLSANRTFTLSRLLLNDCDVETARNNLVLHVTSINNGTTDSVITWALPDSVPNGTVDTLKYRVGEVRTTDTLWGNIATAYITLDTTYMGVDNAETTAGPVRFSLNQNYPNPFKSKTAISYQLPSAGYVNLKVYDMLGRKVATLVDDLKPAGFYSADFNAVKLAGGVYFYRLQAGAFTETKKLILLK